MTVGLYTDYVFRALSQDTKLLPMADMPTIPLVKTNTSNLLIRPISEWVNIPVIMATMTALQSSTPQNSTVVVPQDTTNLLLSMMTNRVHEIHEEKGIQRRKEA
jgi:hypothetical protein